MVLNQYWRLQMTEEELESLLDVVEAMNTANNLNHVEDSLRFMSLKQEHINVFIFGDTKDE